MRGPSRYGLLLLVVLLAVSAVSCAGARPKDPLNACKIFKENKKWYKSTRKVQKKWGVPIHVQLAIIQQESNFTEKAKPPRKKLLWFIPWTRQSSAYGYAQVKDSTWKWYKEKRGRRWAKRTDFGDAVDFVGWYVDLSSRTLKIAKTDTYKQYLAYHEGHGGFKRKTYWKKPWLMKVARKVRSNANNYSTQLTSCKKDLDKKWYWPF